MSFVKKHLAQAKLAAALGKGIMVVTMMDCRVCLMRINLSTNNNVDESCIKPEAKLIVPYGSDEINVYKVFYCDGLLLCITKDYRKLVAWNPYWGQTRWIKPTHGFHSLYRYTYALGHDMSSNSHKILRFIFNGFKILELNSDSWRDSYVPPRDWSIIYSDCGVSLKGNTYWFARKTRQFDIHTFLICFDFTRETFGPPLPLPFQALREDTVSLSSVREEQLAVLFQSLDTLQMEIWVTTKIEPDVVSWSSKVFLSANIKLVISPKFPSFFIDEEKKVAVVFSMYSRVAYIIGVDGSLKEADLGESPYRLYDALVCSYVPSLVQLN